MTLGALAACCFCFTRVKTQPIEFIVSVVIAIGLLLLFKRRDRNTLFYSMFILLGLQLVTFKLASFGYVFGLGIGICIYYAGGVVNGTDFLAILSLIDFSPVAASKEYMIGFNLHALILFAFTWVAKERKGDYACDFL